MSERQFVYKGGSIETKHSTNLFPRLCQIEPCLVEQSHPDPNWCPFLYHKSIARSFINIKCRSRSSWGGWASLRQRIQDLRGCNKKKRKPRGTGLTSPPSTLFFEPRVPTKFVEFFNTAWTSTWGKKNEEQNTMGKKRTKEPTRPSLCDSLERCNP